MCSRHREHIGIICGLALGLVAPSICYAQVVSKSRAGALLHLSPPLPVYSNSPQSVESAQPLNLQPRAVLQTPIPWTPQTPIDSASLALEQNPNIPTVPISIVAIPTVPTADMLGLPIVPSQAANSFVTPVPIEPQPAHHPRRSGLFDVKPPTDEVTVIAEQSPKAEAESSNQGNDSSTRSRAAHWWEGATISNLRPAVPALAININSLIYDALQNSARVQSVSEYVAIAESEICTAQAGFDPKLFAETKYNRLSIPTGTSLDAGFNVLRLREHNWYYSTGFRQKNMRGGNWELAQRIGTKDSNSQFFTPDNQGNSRLSLSYTQPLLSGAGRPYNQSLIVLATIDTRIAADRTTAELQDYLLSVTEAYWEIYRQRTAMLQKKLNFERASLILNYLQQRRDIDSTESQIAVVQSAVSLRAAELVQAETLIRNAEV